MITKIIYVIVSDETDTYLEQALISVYSARLHNQDAHIGIVIDDLTAETIINKREEINKYIDDTIVINIPGEHSKAYRSRFIKTNLRNLVKGDFLFIDTDTIICNPLDDIDDISWDICAVRELNKHNKFSDEEPWMYQLAKKVGIEKELWGEPYFNSGVMYVKDTETTHSLYNKWHQYWQEYTQKGLHTDQTPLCMANKIEGHPIHLLDDTWNCQIKYEGINYAYSAKIVHYFYGMDENEFLFSMHSVLKTIKETGFIPYFIKDIVLHPNKAYMIDAKSMAYIREQGDIRRVYEESKCFFFILQKIGHIYLAFKRRYNFLNKH
jgi:hypothetical protein